MRFGTIGAVILLGLSSSAFANDDAKPKESEFREAITCFPAKDIVKILGKFDSMKPKKKDSVSMVSQAEFTVLDGGPLPERLFMRDGTTETSFTIAPDGSVPDFDTIRSFPKTSELCAEDQTRAGRPKEDDGIEFELDLDVRYHENSGYHDLATIKDGLKDGKSHYKKMLPGPLALLVPKFTHLGINYEAEGSPAQFTAMKEGKPIEGLSAEFFDGSHVIDAEALENLGADGLKISGGAYHLLPMPSIEKMKKFANDDDEKGDKEE